MKNDLPIGIFDSGVGGLTVMRAVADLLPEEDLLYLGDTARVPYGNRGADTIRRYAVNASAMLRERGIKALVVACNTASAHALDALRERFDLPILGVIAPVAAAAAAQTRSGSVGVIGTRGTIASGCYERRLRELGVADVVQTPCPLFVPLAEEGWLEGSIVDGICATYFEAFFGSNVDRLILGCTHYPLLAGPIARGIAAATGHDVGLLDSASATAAALSETLKATGLRRSSGAGRLQFLATDDPDRFRASATQFFGQELEDVQHVDIRDVG